VVTKLLTVCDYRPHSKVDISLSVERVGRFFIACVIMLEGAVVMRIPSLLHT
jgi:hypothetical protein